MRASKLGDWLGEEEHAHLSMKETWIGRERGSNNTRGEEGGERGGEWHRCQRLFIEAEAGKRARKS